MKSILFFCLLFGILLSMKSHAQTACPPGMEAYGDGVCGYSRSEEPVQQAPQQQTPPAQWADRWGAIATFEPNGSLGTVTGMPDQRSAEQTALASCQSKHGSTCKIQLSYRNQCAAMVVGGKIFNVNPGNTVEEAAKKGMSMCSTAANDCHVYYSACSLPQRIQ